MPSEQADAAVPRPRTAVPRPRRAPAPAEPNNGARPTASEAWDEQDTAREHAAFVLAQAKALELATTNAELEAILGGDRAAIASVLEREGQPQPTGEPAPPPVTFPEPEDRGVAALSAVGEVSYVDDLIRPGRIVVIAAEEGSGKSYAVTELGIRVATVGGTFAGTWQVVHNGPVLVLSEMHPDDDYAYEQTILTSLGIDRHALRNRYFRLAVATAAGDRPALQVPEWRSWASAWLRTRSALLAIFDTATAAAQVDPWGDAILGIYRGLRAMLEEHPGLAIVLIVHLKKPQGRASERRISDVLGEWGRWCDVLVLMEADGTDKVKMSSRKRVRRQRRVQLTKRGGLLVDPVDLSEGGGPKVPLERVIAVILDNPGIDKAALATKLEVAPRTAQRYAEEAEGQGRVRHEGAGKRGDPTRYYADEGVEGWLDRADVDPGEVA